MPVHRMVCTAEEAKGNAITLALEWIRKAAGRQPEPPIGPSAEADQGGRADVES